MNANNTWLVSLFSQLAGQLPVLMVYVGGMALCAMWWRRARGAAMWALMGLTLMLVATVGSTAMQTYLFATRVQAGTSAQQLGHVLFAVGIGSSIVRAIGLGMVVAAVFVGRQREESGFEVPMARQAQESF
jgi:hypothetical protein